MTNKMLMLIERVEGLRKKLLESEKDKGILKRKIKLMEIDKVNIEREARLKVVKKKPTELKPKPIPQPRPTHEEPKPTIAKESRKKHEHSIGFKTKSKPQPPKKEPNRPALAISKPTISIEQLTKDDWVVCPDPDKDGWVRNSVECKKCSQENFKKFSECYKERTKDPFSPIFKTSKPNPNL